MPLSLQQSVRVSDDTVFRELDGEMVLLQLDAGRYYGLDDVGTRLWQLMIELRRLEAVVEAALDEFDVTRDQLQRDVLRLAGELVERDLLTLE
jgi:hypothetical protein